MAMMKYGNAAVVNPIVAPERWIDNKVSPGRIKIAKKVIGNYDPAKWLLSHVSIIASVDVDTANEGDCKKDQRNYLIKPEYSIFVNNNGDSWERNLLKNCYKTFLGVNNYCFPAGARVLMANGTYKGIEEVKEGDKVINKNGEVGNVTHTFNRRVNNLIELQSNDIMSRSLFVTGNHPFWVYSAIDRCPKTGRPNNFNRDKVYTNLDTWKGFSRGVHPSADEKYPVGLQPQWKEAKDLDPNRDFFTKPVSSIESNVDGINKNRAELIGWFLAEGSYTNQNIFSDNESGIQFSLGNDEYDIALRLSNLLELEFGDLLRVDCKPRIYEAQSGSHCLYLCNADVAKYFLKYCGKYSWAKVMDKSLMFAPKELQAIILLSCIEGDGCGTYFDRGYKIELKSRALIQQLMWISWRLGVKPLYSETGVLPRYSSVEYKDGYEVFIDPKTKKRSRPGYLLSYSISDSKKLNKLVGLVCKNDRYKKGTSRKTFIFNNEESSWMISKINKKEEHFYDEPVEVFNIEVDNDNSYIVEGISVHNCEHVQIPELSKGKVIDVALREVPFLKKDGKDLTTLYVDILIATNRQHEDLIQKIKTGEYNSTSMGCLIKYSQCSKCGKIAEDETQACSHIRFFKHNFFYDPNGEKRIIAELCGRAEEPDSCRFIDASWVRKPAFEGAVLRNIVNELGDKQVGEKLKEAFYIPGYTPNEGDFRKAASMAEDTVNVINAGKVEDAPAKQPAPTDDTEFPEAPAAEEPVPLDQAGEGEAPLEAPPAEGGLGEGPGPGAEQPAPPIDEPAEDATIKEVKDLVKKNILNQMRRELLKEQAKFEIDRPVDLENRSNDALIESSETSIGGLIKSANSISTRLGSGLMVLSNIRDWKEFKSYGYDRNDVLGILHYVDRSLSKNSVKEDAIRALSRVKLGSKSPKSFFTEIILEIGRKPEASEAKKLMDWGRILNNFA